MKNCKWEIRLVGLASTLVVFLGGSQIASAGSVYDAVADYSISANPNGQWSYLLDAGSGPQFLTNSVVNYGAPGVLDWNNGLSTPDYVDVGKNTTANTVTLGGSIVLPPDLLRMDSQSHKSDITRWTAPSAGTWSISGIFQGIDTSQHSHTVEVLENSTSMLLAPTAISTYGQTVTFSADVSLAAGDTIDFIVHGATNFTNLSTGLSATIQLSSVPEPASLVLGIIASVAYGSLYWRPRRGRDAGCRGASKGSATPRSR